MEKGNWRRAREGAYTPVRNRAGAPHVALIRARIRPPNYLFRSRAINSIAKNRKNCTSDSKKLTT